MSFILQIKLLIDGLFSHFFSEHRPEFHQDDIKWFLEFANNQMSWCYCEVVPGRVMAEEQDSIFHKVWDEIL